MKTVRSTLLAAAILAGVPSLVAAQPPEDGGRGRPTGPGRYQRSSDGQPNPSADQPRPQFQPQQRQDDGGGRRDFRGDAGQPQAQAQPQPQAQFQGQAQPRPDGQRPQGYGRDPARFGQDGRGGFDRRPDGGTGRFGGNGGGDDRRFDNRPPANRPFDDRGAGFARSPGNDRFRGDDRRFDDANRFRGGDNRFDNSFSGNDRFRPDWRNDRRYDWRGYRNDNRQLFRAPRYLPPRGYGFGYRPFARGYQLQPFFYGPNYWISDPWQYRLPPAYGPYRWVRYYNDVLLVDIDTGFVVDVIQNFFW